MCGLAGVLRAAGVPRGQSRGGWSPGDVPRRLYQGWFVGAAAAWSTAAEAGMSVIWWVDLHGQQCRQALAGGAASAEGWVQVPNVLEDRLCTTVAHSGLNLCLGSASSRDLAGRGVAFGWGRAGAMARCRRLSCSGGRQRRWL